MDLDIEFDGKCLKTPIYLKMDAHDSLLLSEGVCRQLGVLSFHPEVKPLKELSPAGLSSARVPLVRVSLVQSVRLLPHQSVGAAVRVEGVDQFTKPLLLEHSPEVQRMTGIQCGDSLIEPREGLAHIVLSNPTGCSLQVSADTCIGEASEVSLVEATHGLLQEATRARTYSVSIVQTEDWRKEKLSSMVTPSDVLDEEQGSELISFLAQHHNAFCLESGELGETNLTEMEINTGDSEPRRVPARRMPLAVRQEVARQLQAMQAADVIRPSNSPWSSPVVMVRKKDGSLRFCVDYRALNAVTKADTFPLPRVDDLVDQLGSSRFFSTLDLASGYWQIRMSPQSREKTAFVVPQGLYEFRDMPFGLTNAPAVFQRLMQRVLRGLNPDDGPDFVSVYIDDVLVFSPTLADHLHHLRLVIQIIQEVGLKLNPAKCRFVRKEVEYLGHILTPDGLKPNPKTVLDSLKNKLASAPVLNYPSLREPFVLETDASIRGLGAILSQTDSKGQTHPVAYASRSLTRAERNYSITELETLAVVWAVSHFCPYLYGNKVSVYTDHSAVKAIFNSPNPSGKHARWWTKVYGSGISDVQIIYRPGRSNANADVLSRSPCLPPPVEGIGENECQVASLNSSGKQTENSSELLMLSGQKPSTTPFEVEQRKEVTWLKCLSF